MAKVVNFGSSLKFCRVAEGGADLYPRFGRTMEWDTCAPQAVLEAAGGSVETLDGHTLRYAKPGWDNPHFVCWAGGRADRGFCEGCRPAGPGWSDGVSLFGAGGVVGVGGLTGEKGEGREAPLSRIRYWR